MTSADVIIIGAGAAGLMAGYELSHAGKRVIVLEARDRAGGRMHTIQDPAFTHELEAGAEFIHGNLPATFALLKKAKIARQDATGKNWLHKNGQLREGEDPIER